VHVTLSFLGACGEAAALRGLAALDGALSERPVAAIEVSLANVVPMGPKRDYSALSALLARGREPTQGCMLALRDLLSEAAVGRRDRRDPIPHVTIARPGRGAQEADRRAGLAWAAALELGHVVARLDRVALYTWSQGARRERRFQIVADRPLRPAGF
jgi:2'-5' RNA ligase